MDYNTEYEAAGKKKKGMPGVLRALLVLLCVLLILSGAVVVAGKVYLDRYYNLSNVEKAEDITHVDLAELTLEELPSEEAEEIVRQIESDIAFRPSEAPTIVVEPYIAPTDAQAGTLPQDIVDETLPSEAIQQTQAPAQQPAQPQQQTVIYSDQVYNLLLVGVDRRNSSWNGNSDSMILMSVNYTKNKIVMTSFMRDTAVSVPGYGVRKLNSAYAIGGGPLLVATIQANFGIYINNYAWVDFGGLETIIDILGGVDVTLTPAEAAKIGVSISSNQLLHLNGQQALVYARDRYSGGYDYARTQHQRNIINALVAKLRSGSVTDAMNAVEGVLPYVNHNIDQNTLMNLLANIPSLLSFPFVEQRVPYDGYYGITGDFLIPNYAATIQLLYNAIY